MSKFSITTETKSTNRVLIPTGISPAYLKSVKIAEKGDESKGSTYQGLSFTFVSTLNDKQVVKEFEHFEFQIDETDAKFESKLAAFNSRIKHIYEAFAPFKGITVDKEDASFLDFMEAIAVSFNEVNDKGKTIFEGVPVNVKLVLSGKRDNISFPYSPNFIERKPVNESQSILSINPKYDKLVATPKAGMGNASDPFAAAETPDYPFM
jgi:hypothetical protein